MEGVFDEEGFNNFISEVNPELDRAEKELEEELPSESGPSNYFQLMMDLEASMELIR